MAEREVLSGTEVEQDVLVNIVDEAAAGAPRVRESHDLGGLLVSVHIGRAEDSLVPLARKVGGRGLLAGQHGRLNESGKDAVGVVEFPHKFTFKDVQHFIKLLIIN